LLLQIFIGKTILRRGLPLLFLLKKLRNSIIGVIKTKPLKIIKYTLEKQL
jgi:hypothetical protein